MAAPKLECLSGARRLTQEEAAKLLRVTQPRISDLMCDVDLRVEFAPDQKTFDHFMGLALFLEELCGALSHRTGGLPPSSSWVSLALRAVSRGT